MKKKNQTFPPFNSLLGYAFVLYSFFALPAYASHVTLAWNPNSEPDLAGYKAYYQAGSSLASGGIVTASTIDIPLAALSDAANPQLSISGLDESASYFFVVTAYNNEGLEGGFSNEIAFEPDPVPDRIVNFTTATNIQMGLQIDDGGNLIRVSPLTSAEVPGSQAYVFPYGIIDLDLAVATPGNTAVVTFYLPESLPSEHGVFVYGANGEWQSLSDYAALNASRTQVTLTLFDGGIGDSDAKTNGEISGIVAFGSLQPVSPITPPESPITPNVPAQISSPGGSEGGGGGGCFIATADPSQESRLGSVFRLRGFWASLAGLAVMLFHCAGRISSGRSSLSHNRPAHR